MRFFSENRLYTLLGSTINESSGTGSLAFDEATRYGWTSNGEDTDGDSVYLENILTVATLIDRIFVKDSNIDNLTITVDLGAGYVALSYDEVQSSSDSKTHLFILNTPISLEKIKISGSNTIIADQEKTIKQVYAFTELGRIENYEDISPSRERVQKINKLQAGKVDVIDFGRYFTFKLKLKTHYVEDDNAVIDMLLQRNVPMFVWINDNTESVMTMYQEPFRFKDIFKVSVQKKDKLSFAKNLFFSGIDESVDMVEVY